MASVRQMPPPAMDEEAVATLTAITATGCDLASDSLHFAEGEFVRLVIDHRILMNGTVAWREGDRAAVRFFGE